VIRRREPLLDPTGDGEGRLDIRLAPRPHGRAEPEGSGREAGLRVGLLSNGKPNAALLLTAFADELARDKRVDTSTMYAKGYFGTPVEGDQIAEIAAGCDLVLAGIGD
jgi:hypothetical protein